MQHADDVVEIVAIHRQPRVPACGRRARTRSSRRRLGGDRDQLGPRHHHLAGGRGRRSRRRGGASAPPAPRARRLPGWPSPASSAPLPSAPCAWPLGAAQAERRARRPCAVPFSSADERPEHPHEELGRLDDQSAVASARSSAILFGVSSPSTMCSAVMIANAMATAMLCAVASAMAAGRNVERRLDDARRAPARRSSRGRGSPS